MEILSHPYHSNRRAGLACAAVALALCSAPARAQLAPNTKVPENAAGESAPAEKGADPEAKAKKDPIAAAKASTAATEKVLKGLKGDGPVKLDAALQAELAALLPGSRPGEECAEPAKVQAEAAGLRERGDGALLLVQVDTCKGSTVFAFSPGVPVRVSRLLDLETGEGLQAAHALNLSGKKREDDVALVALVPPHRSSLRLFVRREAAFAYREAGVVPEFAEVGDCSAGGEVAAGFAGYLKTEKAQLLVLRVDASCGAGPWAARCERWNLSGGGLEHAGVCSLPPKLDAKSLRAAGWK
jgi:hypothetical protein